MDFLPRLYCLCFLVIFSGTSALMAAPAKHESPEVSEINDGYSLLYHLGDEESDVSMLFIVKDAPSEVITFGDDVSKTANETKATLERLQEHDSAIQLDRSPLPPIETDVRASIRADKQHQLLFETSGSDFNRAFLITQIEASTYALNLSKVLADKETNPHRIAALQHISAKWLALRNEAFRILRNY